MQLDKASIDFFRLLYLNDVNMYIKFELGIVKPEINN